MGFERRVILNGYNFAQVRVLNFLRTAEGATVPVRSDRGPNLIAAVWENPDDEPDDPGAEYVIRFAVHCLRNRGYPIATVGWQGYRFKPTLDPSTRIWDLIEHGQHESGRSIAEVSGRGRENTAPVGRSRDLAARSRSAY